MATNLAGAYNDYAGKGPLLMRRERIIQLCRKEGWLGAGYVL
jgi:hypothetical protein